MKELIENIDYILDGEDCIGSVWSKLYDLRELVNKYSEWIEIKEGCEMPIPINAVHVYGGFNSICNAWIDDGIWYSYDLVESIEGGYEEIHEVTHWMPLPKLPED